MSKFSSFKEHQLITENWRKFVNESLPPSSLTEDIPSDSWSSKERKGQEQAHRALRFIQDAGFIAVRNDWVDAQRIYDGKTAEEVVLAMLAAFATSKYTGGQDMRFWAQDLLDHGHIQKSPTT
jgi:hypothetical protein